MNKYANKDLEEALKIVISTINRCEIIQPKFEQGSSVHTLLKNRIKALYISKSLITGNSIIDKYTKDELADALSPVTSIIRKCEKAQLKPAQDDHIRTKKIVKAMYISKSLITEEINKRN